MSVPLTSDQPRGYFPQIGVAMNALLEKGCTLKEIDIRAHIQAWASDPKCQTRTPSLENNFIETLKPYLFDSEGQLLRSVERVFLKINNDMRTAGSYGSLACQTLLIATGPSNSALPPTVLKTVLAGYPDSDAWNEALWGSVPKNMERSKL